MPLLVNEARFTPLLTRLGLLPPAVPPSLLIRQVIP